MLDRFGALALALDTVPKRHFTVLVNSTFAIASLMAG